MSIGKLQNEIKELKSKNSVIKTKLQESRQKNATTLLNISDLRKTNENINSKLEYELSQKFLKQRYIEKLKGENLEANVQLDNKQRIIVLLNKNFEEKVNEKDIQIEKLEEKLVSKRNLIKRLEKKVDELSNDPNISLRPVYENEHNQLVGQDDENYSRLRKQKRKCEKLSKLNENNERLLKSLGKKNV